MLPKRERLSVGDIALLGNGRSVFGPHLSIRYLRVADTSPRSKFSVSISKKVAKTAVERNRIRRRVYVALRSEKEKIKKNVFVMVMPKKECATLPLPVIADELHHGLGANGFIR